MSARRLQDPVLRPDPLQCEAGISDTATSPGTRATFRGNVRRQRLFDFDPYLCQRQATHEIDGHVLCGIHAGQEALARLVGEDSPIRYGPGRKRAAK